MTRLVQRPVRWCICSTSRMTGYTNVATTPVESPLKAYFKASDGVYVRPCCGLPSKAYYDAAVEAGVLP